MTRCRRRVLFAQSGLSCLHHEWSFGIVSPKTCDVLLPPSQTTAIRKPGRTLVRPGFVSYPPRQLQRKPQCRHRFRGVSDAGPAIQNSRKAIEMWIKTPLDPPVSGERRSANAPFQSRCQARRSSYPASLSTSPEGAPAQSAAAHSRAKRGPGGGIPPSSPPSAGPSTARRSPPLPCSSGPDSPCRW